ncbi:hypothetical protein YPPY72_0507, partial [Yersinia pestis PY-72]|jgi:hypothetical protein
MAF